jgi:hypothetical protein
MAILRHTLRIARNLLLGLMALFALLLSAIQVHQRLMRANAERLYREVMLFELLKTSGADAERKLSHWGSRLQREGNCETGECNLAVRGADWVATLKIFANHEWLIRDYSWVGGRVAIFDGGVRIANGVVSRKGFSVAIENIAPPDETGRWHYYLRGGLVQSVSSFREHSVGQCGEVRQGHPEYCVTNPYDCVKCAYEEVYFTPFAPASDVARISEINFYCMTRWSPCRKIADVFPGAAADYIAEDKRFESEFGNLSIADQQEVRIWWMRQAWIHAREAENAVIAEVVWTGEIPMPRGYESTKPYPGAKLRLVEKLKGAKDWAPGELRNLYIGKNHPIGPPEMYASMRVGARFIVLFGPEMNRDRLDAFYYSAWPLNDVNLAQVKFGISRDYLDRYPVMQ